MADLLTTIIKDIDKRLAELRPLVDEYHQLQEIQAALGSNGASAPRRRSQSRGAASKRKRIRMSRADSKNVDKRVLALLEEDPATKPSVLAMMTETSTPGMNSRLDRLVKEGAIKKKRKGGAIQRVVQNAR